jgi:MoaD family protein
MKVTIKFFAAPREALNRAQVEQELPPGATVRQLLERLCVEYPVLGEYMHRVKIAVNLKYTSPEMELHDGDEVACLPPVGGG